MRGALLAELKTILPEEFEARIKRMGIVNAMDDETLPPRLTLPAERN